MNPNQRTVDEVRRIAHQFAAEGPGYAQESVVLRKFRQSLHPTSLSEQQQILEAWQKLFADGVLSWGYDLDNPTSPFYHVTVTTNAVAE